jgi:hypothetical protein
VKTGIQKALSLKIVLRIAQFRKKLNTRIKVKVEVKIITP